MTGMMQGDVVLIATSAARFHAHERSRLAHKGLATIRGLPFIGFIAALACAMPGRAAEGDAYCTDQTQLANDLCSYKRYKAADARMSELYGKLVANLKKGNYGSRVPALESAQKVWEQFRDAECRFIGSGFEGGSMAPMVESDCLTRLTELRAQQILSYVYCDNDKDYLCEKPSMPQGRR